MLLVERHGSVAVVTMNRPEAMNALSKALRLALHDAMVQLDQDPDVSVVVLTGAGDRAFTAGLDLKELGGDPTALGAANDQDARSNPVRAIERCRKPVIGAINGVAITGGFEVALACDVLLASENARFADTHARVGIMPGWGLSQKLSRLIGPYRAKELSLTGNFLDARTAADWGLVNRVTSASELLPAALRMAEAMSSITVDTLAFYKSLIDDGYALALGEGLSLENSRSSDRNRAVTPEAVEQQRHHVMERGRGQ
ncbi:MAG: enoyl-CoA hydratase [Caulobacter sp.]